MKKITKKVKENIKNEDIEEVKINIEDVVDKDSAVIDEEVEITIMDQTKDVK